MAAHGVRDCQQEGFLLAVPWVNSTETLSRGASVTLFVQCTQAMLPGFQLTDENARDIAGICSLLEGVRWPLNWQQRVVDSCHPRHSSHGWSNL